MPAPFEDLRGFLTALEQEGEVQRITVPVDREWEVGAICREVFDRRGPALVFMDLLIHGWDVAKATGQDTRLNPDLAATCLPIAQQLTSQWRSAGVFGEDLPVDADADIQTRLLGLFGRRP